MFIPSQVEPALGLIGASMPALWPLMRTGAQRIYGQMSTRGGSGNGSGVRSLGARAGKGLNSSYNVMKIGMHPGETRFYPLAGQSDLELKSTGHTTEDARW